MPSRQGKIDASRIDDEHLRRALATAYDEIRELRLVVIHIRQVLDGRKPYFHRRRFRP